MRHSGQQFKRGWFQFAASQPEAPKFASPAGPTSSNIGAKRILHDPRLGQRESPIFLGLLNTVYILYCTNPVKY